MRELLLQPRFIAAAILVFIVLVIAFSTYLYRSSPSYEVVHYDEDTGETWIEHPNRDSEAGDDTRPILLGSTSVLETPVTTDQFRYAEEEIITFITTHYQGTYNLVKILPETIVFKPGSTLSFVVKLGESTNLLDVLLTMPSIYEVKVNISEQFGNNTYESDLNNFSAIEVDDEFTGDGLPPESQ